MKKMRLWIEGKNDEDFIEYHVSEMLANSVKTLLDATEKEVRGAYWNGFQRAQDEYGFGSEVDECI